MVRRYSHKAIVTIQSGQLVKGECRSPVEPTEIEVTGQYFPSNSGQQLKPRMLMERNLSYTVSSLQRYVPVENAKRIRIDSIALDVDIICWEPFSDSLCNLCIAMARKGGLTPMWSDREVERWFDYFVDRAGRADIQIIATCRGRVREACPKEKETIRIILVTSVALSVM